MAYATGQLPVGFAADESSNFLDEGAKVVVVPIPTFPGPSQIPWARTWFSLAADVGSAKIRCAVYNETVKNWNVLDPIVVDRGRGMVGVQIGPADSIVSLARMKQSAEDTHDHTPVSWIVQAVLQA